MADFRAEIDALKAAHKSTELTNLATERLGRSVTSVNPLTEAMFERIAPHSHPLDYAQKSENFSEDLKPVAKNATGLKMLLHHQIGRPLHERVGRLTKQDYAECLVAIDAYDEGYERGHMLHVPTTLPQDADGFAELESTRTVESPFDTQVLLSDDVHDRVERWLRTTSDVAADSYFVYVLDCTPEPDTEDERLRNFRAAVQTKHDSGTALDELNHREQAAQTITEGGRVYYVGSTNDLAKRVNQHVVGTAVSGVNFTTTIPPQRLVEVHGCSSRDEAERLEGERAREIQGRENLFAYSDEL